MWIRTMHWYKSFYSFKCIKRIHEDYTWTLTHFFRITCFVAMLIQWLKVYLFPRMFSLSSQLHNWISIIDFPPHTWRTFLHIYLLVISFWMWPFGCRPFGCPAFGCRPFGFRPFGCRPFDFRSFGCRPYGCRTHFLLAFCLCRRSVHIDLLNMWACCPDTIK